MAKTLEQISERVDNAAMELLYDRERDDMLGARGPWMQLLKNGTVTAAELAARFETVFGEELVRARRSSRSLF